MSNVHGENPYVPRGMPAIHSLIAFERAAFLGSFARAADVLGLTPSAISHAVADLEGRFGVRLFGRLGRSVRLTAEGEQYVAAVREALGVLDQAGRRLLRRADDRVIKVSALPFFTSAVLIPHLSDFERRHPDFELRIETSSKYADFRRDDVDVAIRLGDAQAQGLNLLKLLEVRALPICSPRLLPGLRRIEDLRGQALIHVAQMPDAWAGWLADVGHTGLKGKRDLVFDTTVAAFDAVENGLGVGLGMDPLIRLAGGFGERLMAPFDRPGDRASSYYLVSRREDAQTAKVAAVSTWLKGVLRRVAA